MLLRLTAALSQKRAALWPLSSSRAGVTHVTEVSRCVTAPFHAFPRLEVASKQVESPSASSLAREEADQQVSARPSRLRACERVKTRFAAQERVNRFREQMLSGNVSSSEQRNAPVRCDSPWAFNRPR